MSENVPRSRRTSSILRAGTVLCCALAVAVATQGPKQAFAKAVRVPSDETPADDAVVREIERDLVALARAVSGELDARVAAKTDTIAEQATERQTAALLERSLAVRSPIANHAERPSISTFVIRAGHEAQTRELSHPPPASMP
jgi:hypothetical protein